MLSQQKVAEFSASLRGRTVQAGAADYDTSRKVYNAMIDRHNGGGLGICDEGLVIDLSGLKGIRVDAEARTVRVEGGCTWGDLDHATHAFGVATPSGIIGTTGVGGLTLGGGLRGLRCATRELNPGSTVPPPPRR